MKVQSCIKIFAILLLVPLFFVSCSDDPVGGLNPDDIPPAPDFEELRPDFSIFHDHPDNKGTIHNTDGFAQASSIALSVEGALSGLAMWPGMFFQEDIWGDPELVGGVYTWEFSYAFQGEGMSFVVTAEELSNGSVEWQLRFSLQTEEESIDNALFLRVRVSGDGQEGSWEIFDFENPERAVATLNFAKENDRPVYIQLDMADGEFQSQILYEVDGSQSSLILTEDGHPNTEIVWNNETGTGYIISDSEMFCWDENYSDTDCS